MTVVVRNFLFIFFILDAFLQFSISSKTSVASSVRPYLYLQAALPIMFSISMFFLHSNKSLRISSPLLVNKYAIYIALIFLSFAYSTLLGLFISPIKTNVVLDLLRSASPFIVYVSVAWKLTYADEMQDLASSLVSAVFIQSYALLFAKIVLTLQGKLYGGGAYQFQAPVLVVVMLFWAAASPKNDFIRKVKFIPKSLVAIAALLFIFIVFTILSLKRENWAILIISVLFGGFAVARFRRSTFIFLFLLGAIIVAYYQFSNTIDTILIRFQYTFSGAGGSLDRSSFERVAEIKGVLYTLGSDLGFVEYITGRGNGAEFETAPGYASAKDQTGSELGSYRHVHNMYFLLIFRNGIIGLVLYIVPVLVAIYFSFLGIRRRSRNRVLYFALMGQSAAFIISGIPANSIYGSFFYGVFLLLCAATVLGDRYEKNNG